MTLNLTEQEKSEMFEFLEAIRQSGKTNMFGAGVYLSEAFGIDKSQARDVLLEWMGMKS